MNSWKTINHGVHGEKIGANVGLINDRSDKTVEELDKFFAVPAVFAVVNWSK